MRLLEILIGLGIAIGCGLALSDMPWSIESTCARSDDGVRCEVKTQFLFGPEQVATLGPGEQVEARAFPVGDGDKAFRPRIVVGKDAADLPLLVDTHGKAVGTALKHTTLGAPVQMDTSHGRHGLTGGFGLLGLVLALNALRRLVGKK
jgi:hypothetical protein